MKEHISKILEQKSKIKYRYLRSLVHSLDYLFYEIKHMNYDLQEYHNHQNLQSVKHD